MDPFLDDAQDQSSSFDIMGLLRTFWRRKLLFFIPSIICLAMAGIVIKTMTPIYSSSAQIAITVNSPSSRLLDDPRNRFGGAYRLDINGVAYQEMSLLLFSPGFLEKMALELGLHTVLREAHNDPDRAPPTEEEAVVKARKWLYDLLRLRSDGDRLFRIEARDPDPALAYQIAKHVVERFTVEYRDSQTATSTSTRDFLERQLQVYQDNLRLAEKALNEYQGTLASAALAGNPINASNLSTAVTNLTSLRQRFNGPDAAELTQLGQAARLVLGSLPGLTNFRSDPTVASGLSELGDLELESRLSLTGSRDGLEVEQRLGQLRVRVRSQIETLVAQAYPNAGFMDRNQISQFVYFSIYRSVMGDIIERLDSYIRQFRDFTARQPGQSSRLADLQSAVTRERGLVESLESEITQHNMNLAASQSEIGFRVGIRREAELPTFPIEPNKLKLMAMGAVLSLGIGVGLVVLAMLLDKSFTTVESIEKTLGLAVIGTLPMIQDDHFERKRKVRIMRWITIVLGILAVGAVGFLVVYPRLS